MDEKNNKIPNIDKTKELTCLICSNVFLKPIKLSCCNIILCDCCLRMYVSTNGKCAGCSVPMDTSLVIGLPVDTEVEKKVSHSFPLYKFFREKIQYVSEKQWWFDIHHRRSNLHNIREKLVEFRVEKKLRLEELKIAFCNFIKICKKESMLNKTFEREHAHLQKRTALAQKTVPLTKDRYKGFASLPCRTCCLQSLTKHLETVLCSGPDVLIEQHPYLERISSGEDRLPPCDVCKGDLMAADSYLGSEGCRGASPKPCEPRPCDGTSSSSSTSTSSSSSNFGSNISPSTTQPNDDGINEICSSMESLLKLSTPCPGEVTPPTATAATTTAASSKSYEPTAPTKSELDSLDEATILRTCAKIFSQSSKCNSTNNSVGQSRSTITGSSSGAKSTCSSFDMTEELGEGETAEDLEC